MFTDIDDQRRAEEALRESEQHLRLLVETIPALVGRTTAEGKLDYVNRRVVDYIGQELELIGMRSTIRTIGSSSIRTIETLADRNGVTP